MREHNYIPTLLHSAEMPLLRRGEPLEADVQRRNIEAAVKTISEIAKSVQRGSSTR